MEAELDDEAVRLLGVPKSNLGRTDLPTLAFTIAGTKVADTDDGEVWSSRVEWQDDPRGRFARS